MEGDALVLVHSHPWGAAFGVCALLAMFAFKTFLLPSLAPSLLEKSLHGWEEERGQGISLCFWQLLWQWLHFLCGSNWTGLLQF